MLFFSISLNKSIKHQTEYGHFFKADVADVLGISWQTAASLIIQYYFYTGMKQHLDSANHFEVALKAPNKNIIDFSVTNWLKNLVLDEYIIVLKSKIIMIQLMRQLSQCESVSFGVNLPFKLNLVKC